MLVAGFQGVSTSRDVTTLGRGGSDTTAVALAAAIGAEVCEIYTDVAGVFTADPRVVPNARKLPMVSFEEMLEMAASGAKVLQLRSVEYARTHGVRIHCRSSFDESPGTFVIGEDETMEHPLITAVTHSTEEARITLIGVPDRPGAAAAIFRALADANCNVDTIIQNEPREEGRDAEVSFTIASEDLRAAERALEPVMAELGIARDRHRSGDRQGLDHRRRHALPSRRGRAGVRDAGRPGDQHRDDLDLADQDLLRDPLRGGSRGRAGAARDLPAEPGGGPARATDRTGGTMTDEYRVAVVGATGVVGTTMLELLRERRFPASEIVPFATERSAGRELDGGLVVRALNDEADLSGFDLALFSAGGGTSREWAPRFVRGRRHRGRQLLGLAPRPGDPAGRLRGQPARARAPPRPDRQPELLDHAADGGAGADPPPGRDRAAGRVHLPVGVRHRQEGDRRARRPGPGAI